MLLSTVRCATREFTEHLSEELGGQGIPFELVTMPAVRVPMVELIRAAMSEKGLVCHSWMRDGELNVCWASRGQQGVTLYAQAD